MWRHQVWQKCFPASVHSVTCTRIHGVVSKKTVRFKLFFFGGNKVKSKTYSLRLSETHGRWEIFIKFHSWTLKKLRPRGKNHGWKRLLILEKLNGLNSHGKVRKSSPTISRVKSEQKSNIPGCVLSLSSKNDTIRKTSGTQNPATFIIYYPSKIHSDFLKCFFSVHPCIIM